MIYDMLKYGKFLGAGGSGGGGIEVTGASVGQTIVVKAVDDNGKPTEWETADLPQGGGEAEWKLLKSETLAEDVAYLQFVSEEPINEIVVLVNARVNDETDSLTNAEAGGSVRFVTSSEGSLTANVISQQQMFYLRQTSSYFPTYFHIQRNNEICTAKFEKGSLGTGGPTQRSGNGFLTAITELYGVRIALTTTTHLFKSGSTVEVWTK